MQPTLPLIDAPQFAPSADDAGFGALLTSQGAMPLLRLGVHVRLTDLVAVTDIEQTFVNTHLDHLEATYIFPLPPNAAVNRFRLEVAGRVVEGELQERNQARRTYNQAIATGHRAAIAEEERPGVFTIRVGNLPPGERATVRLSLTGTVPYADGEASLRIPMVVAPRYIPGTAFAGPQTGTGTSSDTDQVPDASRISPPVRLPGYPNPVDLQLTVEVRDTALSPHDFRSTLHTVVEERTDGIRFFRVLPGERLDRDFVFRYRLASERMRSSLLACNDNVGGEGTFLLTLVPPARKADAPIKSRNVVFVLDRSGSMAGWKMIAARRAVSRMVETLTDRDRFAVYAFDDGIETPTGLDGTSLVAANPRHRFLATEYLAKVESAGGTEMAQPLEQAVKALSAAPAESDRLLVLLTDGQVGNEDDILRRIGAGLKNIRVFTLGIDRAVNEGFLRRLADVGGGGFDLVESEARLDEVMQSVHRRISTPTLTALEVSDSVLGILPGTIVPTRLPDVMADVPVMIAGRFKGRACGVLTVTGTDASGKRTTIEIAGNAHGDAEAVRAIWARYRIRELEDAYAVGAGSHGTIQSEIVAVSLTYRVLSRFTAFVAVDRSEIVNTDGKQTKVTQSVETVSQDRDGEECELSRECMEPQVGGGFGYASARRMRSMSAFPPMAAPAAPAPASPPPAKRKAAPRSASALTRSAGPGGGGILSGIVEAVSSLFGGKAEDAPADLTENLKARLKALPADAQLVVHLRRILIELDALLAERAKSGRDDAKLTRTRDLLQSRLMVPGADIAELRRLASEIASLL